MPHLGTVDKVGNNTDKFSALMKVTIEWGKWKFVKKWLYDRFYVMISVIRNNEGKVDVKGRMTLPTTLPREDMSKKGETGRERTMRKNFL